MPRSHDADGGDPRYGGERGNRQSLDLLGSGTDEVLSGGNFHAEPVAFAADILALASVEIGSIAERRVALLVDPKMSGLPAFLTQDSGVNSGFMMAQVTAAALVAENRMLSHPASVDSIPTSANQEDHVSMATHGARRVLTMAANTLNIIAIEFLAGCQGIDFRKPLKTSPSLQQAQRPCVRKCHSPAADRLLADDIAAAADVIRHSPGADSRRASSSRASADDLLTFVSLEPHRTGVLFCRQPATRELFGILRGLYGCPMRRVVPVAIVQRTHLSSRADAEEEEFEA